MWSITALINIDQLNTGNFSREIKKTLSYNNPFSWKISKFFVPRCSLLPPLFYTQNTNICIHIGWKLFLHVRPMWCPWKTQKLTFVWQNSCFDLSFSTKDTRHYYNPLKFFEISWIPSFFLSQMFVFSIKQTKHFRKIYQKYL